MRLKLLLLITTVLLGFTQCFSTYSATHITEVIPAASNYDYFEWKDYAWKTPNPRGICAHLATYETMEEFDLIFSAIFDNSVYQLSPDATVSFYLGAQKQPNSNTFVWAVGSRRGQPFFSANILSDDPTHRYRDINFESGFLCHQKFCFNREVFGGFSGVYDAEIEAVLIFYNRNGIIKDNNYIVLPDDYTNAEYGVLEYEDAGRIANPTTGGSKFIISSSELTWIEANNQANIGGTYLARIETAEQERWILDELQCTVDDHYWIGYQEDRLHKNIIKGPGPAQRQVVYDPNTGCIPDMYCRYSESKKRSETTFTGVKPNNAISFSSSTGDWQMESIRIQRRYIVQAEYCSFNAQNFFRNNIIEDSRSQRVCVPNPTNLWSDLDHLFDSNHNYFIERSFFGGAGTFFANPENGAKKLLYFDCNCETDPIIDKACLGSRAFPSCSLYTNNFDYYTLGWYGYILKNGLGYDERKYEDYLYWNFLYNHN